MTTEERIRARIEVLTQAKTSAEHQVELINIAIGELGEMLRPENVEVREPAEVEGAAI